MEGEKRNKIVYQHLKPNGEIFYIGIGSLKRSKSKSGRSNLWKNFVNKYGYTIEILYTNLTKEEAKNLEINLISYYGRIDKKTGILVNHTDGGDGVHGYIMSEETKQKMIVSLSGENSKLYKIPRTEEVKRKISEKQKGKIISNKTKNKMSLVRLGKSLSSETKEKMKLANNTSKILLDMETGIFYNSIKEASQLLNIPCQTLHSQLTKKHLQYKTNLRIV